MGQLDFYGGATPDERGPNAATVLRVVAETFAEHGVPVSSRHKAIIGKQAKELLEDDFDEQTVIVASVIALRRGQPQNMHFVAADLVMARAGQRMTRREYEIALQDEMELGGRR